MTNYCDNSLKITGKTSDIEEILAKYVSIDIGCLPKEGKVEINHTLDFNKIYPVPLKEDGSLCDNWYEWRIENWGTKWDAMDCYFFSIYNTKDGVVLETDFTTAWAPPIGVYEKLAKELPNLNIKASYYEGGCAFVGEIELEDGEIVDEDYKEFRDGDILNNINYYALLIEKGHETSEWLCEEIEDMASNLELDNKAIDTIAETFCQLIRINDYVGAATIYVNILNNEIPLMQ